MRGLASSIVACLAALCLFMNGLAVADVATCSGIVPMAYRNDKISITDFGGVGDGQTLNTKAFRAAVYRIEHLKRRGGTLLYVPPGVFLTEAFNLTSHMTLYLAKGAVIRATKSLVITLAPITDHKLSGQRLFLTKNSSLKFPCGPGDCWSSIASSVETVFATNTRDWPLIAPLPSYGRGRERPGGRYMSFIHGDGLHDVIITGENGTIDGQGDVWWNMWRQRTLQYTRPNLVEFMHSRSIIISNVIFKNSPFWNIHPVYCSNVVVRYVTILAPPDSPNTDGIDPDSSSHVCIEDSYISTGDDLVAVKSGWDEYGIAYGRPSSAITIRRITGSSPYAGIAIGSETSGGVVNVLAENINLYNMGVGIHLKTNIGRGGVIRNITVSDVFIENARKGIKIAGDVGDHPDENYDPNALPVVKDVTIKNVWGYKVQQAGSMQGLKNSPFTRICLSNINLHGAYTPRNSPWTCSDVSGAAVQVNPWPCSELTSTHETGECSIPF